MITFWEALKKWKQEIVPGEEDRTPYFSFTFGDKKEYELCIEPLLFGQFYIALYKEINGEKELILPEKVVIMPGK